MTDLTSLWGNLSGYLIAEFYKVVKNKNGSWSPDWSGPTVKAPLTESNMEVSLSWQSPFENAGTDHGLPTVSAMLQSGALQPFLNSSSKTSEFVSKFEGRTGITRLNSVQVFTGMPPVKIQVTAMFRAWKDAREEVEAPFSQLMEWALPQDLAKEGVILSAVDSAKAVIDGSSLTEESAQGLFPSLAPVCIAMRYKNRLYSPLVIESIGQPMNSPVDASGNYTELQVPMTLCTLTAFDAPDWRASRK